MKRQWKICVLILAGVFLCSPLLAYQLAMKDGRIVEFQKYRVENGNVICTDANGKETSVMLGDVDLEKTKTLNAKETPALDLGSVQSGDSSPAAGPGEEGSLGDAARKMRQQGKAHASSQKHKFTDDDVTHASNSVPETDQKDGKPATGDETKGGKQASTSAGTKSAQRKEVTDAQISAYYDLGRTDTGRAVLAQANLPPDTPFPDRSEWEARLFEGKKEWVQEYVHCKEHQDDEAACGQFVAKFQAWEKIADEGVERAKQYLATHPQG